MLLLLLLSFFTLICAAAEDVWEFALLGHESKLLIWKYFECVGFEWRLLERWTSIVWILYLLLLLLEGKVQILLVITKVIVLFAWILISYCSRRCFFLVLIGRLVNLINLYETWFGKFLRVLNNWLREKRMLYCDVFRTIVVDKIAFLLLVVKLRHLSIIFVIFVLNCIFQTPIHFVIVDRPLLLVHRLIVEITLSVVVAVLLEVTSNTLLVLRLFFIVSFSIFVEFVNAFTTVFTILTLWEGFFIFWLAMTPLEFVRAASNCNC